MFWPTPGNPDPDCIPMCLKVRGVGSGITDYGRHGSCNENKATARRIMLR